MLIIFFEKYTPLPGEGGIFLEQHENMIKNLLTFDPAPRRGEAYILFYKKK